MNWELVRDDPYYQARMKEDRASREETPEIWEEFADLKAQKGSYLLSALGYMNGAILCEREGQAGQATVLYNKAFEICQRAKYKELLVIVSYRCAALSERLRNWDGCIGAYERLGHFCEEVGSYFLAADAYDHAAETMIKAGRDVSGYTKPIELWERNALYWEERGEEDDAEWSRRHIGLYRKLFGVGGGK